jgi:hypothetical protein
MLSPPRVCEETIHRKGHPGLKREKQQTGPERWSEKENRTFSVRPTEFFRVCEFKHREGPLDEPKWTDAVTEDW